jgi:hypothetical protein
MTKNQIREFAPANFPDSFAAVCILWHNGSVPYCYGVSGPDGVGFDSRVNRFADSDWPGGICVAQVMPDSGWHWIVLPGTDGMRMRCLQSGH